MTEIKRKREERKGREVVFIKVFLNVIILTRTNFAFNQHYHVSQLYYVSLMFHLCFNITRVLNTCY